ncbi:N-6 DNA methylase [Nocardia transvalensis]|uniref:N-6 DNA methylase n=1 Tax=Nocardia transvalensis TaxID=37333 RepID=UPI001895A4F0|nr:N-6 DNA methylase [Nocardia transvalensis]MBF6333501.1 N-6 DNA methylase [Nocardia transvalensis]
MTGAPARPIAEAVAAAWRRHSHTGERIEIPLGTVAALALLEVAAPAAPRLPSQWRDLDAADTIDALRMIWGVFWVTEPYLVEVARPLHDWLTDDHPRETLTAVRTIIDTSFQHGLLDLTGHADPALRSDVDLLGAVLTELRAPGDRQHRGEFHTPTAVADILAAVTLSDLPPEATTSDEPAVGTGGLFRATAQRIRALGGDPQQYAWSMTDIDRLATACCAVNAAIWGLGPDVLIHRGDILTEPDGLEKAEELRRRVLAHRDSEIRCALLLEAAHRFDRLFTGARGPRPEDGRAA